MSGAGLGKAWPHLPKALPPHVLGIGLAAPSVVNSPGPAGEQHGEGDQGQPGDATVLLMKSLYRPPSADTGRITHRPWDGSPFIWGHRMRGGWDFSF